MIQELYIRTLTYIYLRLGYVQMAFYRVVFISVKMLKDYESDILLLLFKGGSQQNVTEQNSIILLLNLFNHSTYVAV